MKLREKLLLAFVVVVLVAVTLSALVAGTATRSFFSRYVEAVRARRVYQWGELFITYYQKQGGWEGVQALVTVVGKRRGPGGPARSQGVLETGERIILTTPDGMVIADSWRTALGERLSPELLTRGTVLKVGGQPIGILLYHFPPVTGLATLERAFFRSVLHSIVWGGLGAVLLAAALGLLFAQRLSNPLVLLTRAAEKLAGGDLSQRVDLPQGDEIGELALTFNAMAEALERTDRQRKNLMADVAHELRTPLAILQGNLEALQEGVMEPTPAVIISLHDEVLRLSRLVQDLQDLSLAEAGNLPLARREVHLPDLVETVLAALEGQAIEKGVQIGVDLPPQLPAVVVDPDRITQVLFNLLSNALRYTPAGGKIQVTARVREDRLEVAVLDTGPGLDPADLPYVFDRFFRGDKGRDRRSGGTGLGLAIAKGLVEAHGGQIWAENRPEGGACFAFTIPLAP